MLWRIEITTKGGYADVEGQTVLSQIRDFGIASVHSVSSAVIYDIIAELNEEEMERVAREILADAVLNEYSVTRMSEEPQQARPHERSSKGRAIQISRKPGVMDPVEQSALKAIRDLGFEAQSVKTIRNYVLEGKVTDEELDTIARKILANEVIEDVTFDIDPPFQAMPEVEYEFNPVTVDILDADDETLLGISRKEINARTQDIIDFADLPAGFIDQPVKRYSSGMYARLAFAVAIHVDADILVVTFGITARASERAVNMARERGVLLNCTADTVLRFLPPLVITESEIDRVMAVVGQL